MAEHKKTKKRTEITPDHLGFGEYIRRVSRRIHPDINLSKSALQYIEDLNKYLIKEIMKKVNTLLDMTRAQTVSCKDIQAAVKLTIQGQLQKHAVSELVKAVTKFNTSQIEKGAARSRSARAGLIFPVSRIDKIIRELSTDERLGGTTPVCFAAVLEYITAEILELAGNATRDNKRKTIMVRDIVAAIDNDSELKTLFASNTIQTCGASKGIQSFILPKKNPKKKSK